MKTIQFKLTFLLILALGLTLNSCVEDDEFEIPDVNAVDPNIPEEKIVEIGSILGTIAQNDGDNFTIDSDIYVEGYVVSSDEAGNFFEEIIIQDKPENPTAGIRISINVNPLFSKYDFGRRILVKLQGLTVGITNGVAAIGTVDGNRIGQIQESQADEHLLRTSEVADIVALPVTISDFSNDLENLYIQLDNMQFPKSSVITDDLTFAAEPGDEFDGERIIESCETGNTTILSTSTFSDFRFLHLPTQSGSISAVLSRDFFDEFYTLALNSTEGIDFINEERCDPVDIDDFNIVFEEDFSTGFNNGWDVINTVGTQSWFATSFNGDFYARASAFNDSGADFNMISWLISPSFDFDINDDEQLVLEIADAFSDAGEEPLKAYYSTDYVSGTDPDTANWIEIGTSEIEGLPVNTGFFDNEYDRTGLIDLSTVTGTGFIAFVYDSDGGSISSTRDLGNVKILTPM